jgi:hypothetical protein
VSSGDRHCLTLGYRERLERVCGSVTGSRFVDAHTQATRQRGPGRLCAYLTLIERTGASYILVPERVAKHAHFASVNDLRWWFAGTAFEPIEVRGVFDEISIEVGGSVGPPDRTAFSQ